MTTQMIGELIKVRDETKLHYASIRDECEPKSGQEPIGEEDLKRKLFANKSCFVFQPSTLVKGIKNTSINSIYTIYLIILDFYIDQDIQRQLA